MKSAASPTQSSPPCVRHRATYVRVLLLTITMGLGSRRFGAMLPRLVAQYAGDVLWATMVFWLLAIAVPGAARLRLAAAALTVAWAVECSQLYRAPWLDALRATSIGALVLGQGFLWSDLLCYAAGVALAVVLDRMLWRTVVSTSGG
jgi:Protein of unknown function (DUF2809)